MFQSNTYAIALSPIPTLFHFLYVFFGNAKPPKYKANETKNIPQNQQYSAHSSPLPVHKK